ncbi:MAG: polX 1 [Verrucomicrobiales bacterium]|nr:polX 1 [Verrucomicrobiales bacterium]
MSRNALTNSDIAELLALEANASGRPMVSKALRKASRAALLWPVEVVDLLEEDRSLTELNGVGPFISKTLQGWMDKPPKIPAREETRKGFLTITEARSILLANPKWKARYKGDLQMHTVSSDGSGTLHDMALAGLALGYEYIGVTDHSKGLKIANGIDEAIPMPIIRRSWNLWSWVWQPL